MKEEFSFTPESEVYSSEQRRLITELNNVCQRYAVKLDPEEVREALMLVAENYSD